MTKKTEPRKTVMVRFPVKIAIHRGACEIHDTRPNSMTFAETLAEILEAGVDTLKKGVIVVAIFFLFACHPYPNQSKVIKQDVNVKTEFR